MKNKAFKVAAFMVAGALSLQTAVFASPLFNDVPAAHWANAAITAMARREIMLGDTTGNFRPNDFIDKFDTMRILARAAGYQPADAATAYDKHKGLLDGYARAYTRWNASADREIAFLIERGVVVSDDLNHFIIRGNDGKEQLRALSRQEAAVFLVRLMGRTEAAQSHSVSGSLFRDDAGIAAINKPFVYYLRGQGIVAGDTEGRFNPNAAVTRAAMAVMLDKTLALMAEAPPVNSNVNSVANISCTFDRNYPQLSAVQVILADHTKKIYRLSPNAAVTIDGFSATAADLREGMALTIVVANDDEILDIRAQKTAVTSPVPLPTPAPVPTPDNNTQPATQTFSIEGLVIAREGDAAGTLDVEIRMLNPRGDIVTEKRTYALSATTRIRRDGEVVNASAIMPGDVVRVDYVGNAAVAIALEPKDRTFTNAELMEKKVVEPAGTPIFVLRVQNGKTHELRVSEETALSRRGISNVTWRDIRIGDSITATAQYDRLIQLDAQGIRSEMTGVIQAIHLTQNSSAVVVLDQAADKSETYTLMTDLTDQYALRLGDTVRLRLDSREVESVTVVAAAAAYTGFIQSITGSRIVLSDVRGTGGTTRDIVLEPATVVTSASNGTRINPATLKTGMRITVNFTTAASNTAKDISILSH